MPWTEQQQSAIDARNSSVIVSAAAGSGKTAVLTERLVQLIADPNSGVRADRMIVVTFTNDAAAELKKRLDMKLRSLINDDPGNSHLLKQQVLLQNARISTINSFCFELLRDNITDEGITSGFTVIDDTENNVLKMQAMEELFDYYSSEEYEKISFLYDRFCVKDERRLTEVISLTDNFLSSVTFRDKWLDSAVNGYKCDFRESAYFGKIGGLALSKLKRAMKISESCCRDISAIFPDMSVPAAVRSLEQAEDDREIIEKLIRIFEDGRFPTEAEMPSFSDLVRVGKTVHSKELREIYKTRRDRLKKITADALESIASAERDYAEAGEVTVILAEVIRKYHEIIWAKKCAKNALSFDDGERLALELLSETDENGRLCQSEIARKTAEYYDLIMIDEYQDSNNKEDMIFKLLSKNFRYNDEYGPMYGDNVFLVGDVKQSIYRFRLANPKNFIRTLRASEPYTKESENPNKSIVLNRNFRSSEGVIGFVNYVFGQIMTAECGDIDYTEDEQLYFGAEIYDGAPENMIRTCINFINDDPDDNTEEAETVKITGVRTSPEVEYTAGKIAEMLKNNAEVIVGKGETRACRPSDFCVLVRNNRFVRMYVKALEERGVPVREIGEEGYLRSREIAVLLDLLRIINNPLLDVPMAAVMTSPMYMFTVGEIAYLKSLDRSLPLFSVIRGLADGAYNECTDMFLIGRCREFLEALDGFRLDSVTMTVGELIDKIYDTTDFISVMQLQSNGEKKRANLRALIRFAAGYEASSAFEGSGGLGGFLRHTDRIMASGDYTQGKGSASSGEYVVVQTLHGSKGLEYPFVFIAETSCLFKYDSDAVMCSDDGRVGYVLYDPKIYRRYKTFQQIMLSNEAKRDTRSEEMRLLYVGLTRAKQQLFVNLKCGEKALKKVRSGLEETALSGGDSEDMIHNAECFADWIWACIFASEEFDSISAELDISTKIAYTRKIASHGKMFDCEFIGNVSVREEITSEEQEHASADTEICSEIRSMITAGYDRTLSETPSKLSVTQITKKFDDEDEPFDFRLRRPRFISGESMLTGAERGTAIHTFFQYCSFESAIEDVDSEIDRIRKMGYITQLQADSISRENASAFFRSDLYRRIVGAKEIWREKKFMVALFELGMKDVLSERFGSFDGMIKGIIDLMFEEENGIVIVDYKSDRQASEECLRERYAVQLKLYCSAVELITGKSVTEAYLYSFELRKAIKMAL